MRHVAILVIGLATALGMASSGNLSAAEGTQEPAAPSIKERAANATPEQVQAWVLDLNSDEFIRREEATALLVAAGPTAAKELKEAKLDAQNLEVVARGLYVLQELALSGDSATEAVAREALEQLATSKNRAASRRASDTLVTLNELRQQRASQELEQLGASVSISTTQIGLVLVHEVPTIEIDDSFKGTAEDLKRLRYLPDVRLVQLSGKKINGEVLEHVGAMKGVNYLTIKRAKISTRDLAPLTKLDQLQHLSILYCPIDDGAANELAKIKTLTDVRLFGTEMSRKASDRLAAALGNAKVDYRHGAFLGIGCTPAVEGCAVTIVHPGSAAHKAGIESNDIVTRFDGEIVRDFEGLTALIARHRAGDKVTFEILRNGETRTVEVVLGEWD